MVVSTAHGNLKFVSQLIFSSLSNISSTFYKNQWSLKSKWAPSTYSSLIVSFYWLVLSYICPRKLCSFNFSLIFKILGEKSYWSEISAIIWRSSFQFFKKSVSSLGSRKLSYLQGTKKPKYLKLHVIKIKDVHTISNPVWHAVICVLFWKIRLSKQ